jgi:alpha-L-fucosidase 2
MHNSILIAVFLVTLSGNAVSLLAQSPSEPGKPEVQPLLNTASVMPKHGTVSIAPATRWEDSLATGNGIMGALLAGDPVSDTLIVNHCKLWLPLGSREVVPDVGAVLPEMRRIIGEKGYDAGQKYFLSKAKEQGWDGKLVWTDPFHPGFVLKIDQPPSGSISDYARIEDFSTGEVSVQWNTENGQFERRLFVSRPDNAMVLALKGPQGELSVTIRMDPIGNKLINSSISHSKGWITCQNQYANGKGGYDGAVRVVLQGGTASCDGSSVQVSDATTVLLILRIQPWKTPLPGSEAWPFNEANPDFQNGNRSAPHVQKAARSYDPAWMKRLQHELTQLTDDYAKLLKRHAKAHGAIFNRVSVDLGGDPVERGLSTEALLNRAQKEKRLPAALLERMYDAGRYVFLCSAGPDTPPNLFGIWTGTWQPAWSGDYTLDTNIQLDIESAFSGNMPECMEGYFRLMESFLPDFRLNARKLYGCRGILSGSRASNTGIHLHWDAGWPGNLWTPGAPWLAHWFYNYYLYTGDVKFLRERAVPWMKECALFYEDFLRGTEDANGHYTFRPSFSAENGWADNATQDISICRELLSNLIAACNRLDIEKEGILRWKGILAKLPPYLINAEGQLKEWATPEKGENNNHRHLMHLYGAFESGEFSEESDPKIFEAARVALRNRLKECRETSTHGYMHTALAGTRLAMANEAYERLKIMATGRSMYANMVTAHEPGPAILCDDGNGAIPQVVNRMVAQSAPGELCLLPAIPDSMPKGLLKGTLARGQIRLDEISWDLAAGTMTARATSAISQELDLVFGRDLEVSRLTLNGKPQPVANKGVRKQGARIKLPAGKTVTIEASFQH